MRCWRGCTASPQTRMLACGAGCRRRHHALRTGFAPACHAGLAVFDRWRVDLGVFVICGGGLVLGALTWLLGERAVATAAWILAAIAALLPLAWQVLGALRRREAGVDVLALVAIGGALLLHEHLTAAVIALMFAGGTLLESHAERRARRELSALLAHAPRSAQRYEGGGLVDIPLEAIAPGDRLVVRHGEVLAVDGTLTAERAVLDESTLTGESLPVTWLRGDRLRSGAINAGDAFDMVATAVVADSTFAAVVRLVEAAQQSRAPAVRLADRYALWFVPLALLLAALAWLVSGDPLRALAVLVVATPCPLLLAVPIAVVAGISRCARRGILVKDGAALEGLAASQTLFFDKTGTLTGGQARLIGIEGVATADADHLLALAASLEQLSSHVIATAVVGAARQRQLALQVPREVSESAGAGISGRIDGARVSVGSLDYVSRVASVPLPMRALLERSLNEGASAVLVAVDGQFAGMLLLADQLRVEAPRALRLLRRSGIGRIVMLTGDRREVAEAIGAGLGVDEVLAEHTPAGKLAVIKAARANGRTVMVGDGINDAPALAAADVGVAMGARGATASAEAADIVLIADRLDRLAEALRIARDTRRIALQSVFAGMGLSLLAMAVAALGYLPPLYGAALQEAIDVAVILNALRVLRIQPLRTSQYRLDPAQVEHLHAEHRELEPVLDRLSAVADRLPTLQGDAFVAAVREVEAMLRERVLPHEQADDHEVYPQIAALLGGDDPLAAMSRSHREIFRLHRRLAGLVAGLSAPQVDARARQELQRTLHALDAILRLHFLQEEEIYQNLAPD